MPSCNPAYFVYYILTFNNMIGSSLYIQFVNYDVYEIINNDILLNMNNLFCLNLIKTNNYSQQRLFVQ